MFKIKYISKYLDIDRVVFSHFSHLLQNFHLHEDEHRRYFVGEHVGIGRGGQPFSSHRDDVQAIGELVHEAGMSYINYLKVKMT